MIVQESILLGERYPQEVERLLNPAYCASALARYTLSYVQARSEQEISSLGFPLMFLCLPLVLHAPTRSSVLMHTSAFGLHRFVREHPGILVDLPERVRGLADISRQAFLFGVNRGILMFDAESASLGSEAKVVRRLTSAHRGKESSEPLRAADRLGAWCGILSAAEVFLHLGLRP